MAKKDLNTSTSYSAARYAHPFFLPAQPGERQPINGQSRMTDWSKQQLGPIPAVANNGRIELADIIGKDGVQEITQLGEMRFHALGDSGVSHAVEAEQIAEDMATDYRPGAGGLNPTFLFHLGDVIYGPDKENHYCDRFYRPYRLYPGKIIAIPGNHDGEVTSQADEPSLQAFRSNFCSDKAGVPKQAADSGIYRQTMTLPGVYWLLDAPFVRIVGLYSNRLENPGFLEGRAEDGTRDLSQLDWLSATLKTIAQIKEKKVLIIATHHPPFSQSGHSGSTEMSQSLDDIFKKTGVIPDAVFSAHAHSYQRYTRRIGGKQVPYIVIGTGGMAPQNVTAATGEPADASNQTTYDNALAALGYLYVTISANQLKTEFWPLGNQHASGFDPLTIDLRNNMVTTPS